MSYLSGNREKFNSIILKITKMATTTKINRNLIIEKTYRKEQIEKRSKSNTRTQIIIQFPIAKQNLFMILVIKSSKYVTIQRKKLILLQDGPSVEMYLHCINVFICIFCRPSSLACFHSSWNLKLFTIKIRPI